MMAIATGPDDLPPTEYLMMEVLAARLRLGETHWTFPRRLRDVARSLEAKGYVSWKSGVAEGTIMVWASLDAEAMFLSPTYVPPA
jgi:hypothetical protein